MQSTRSGRPSGPGTLMCARSAWQTGQSSGSATARSAAGIAEERRPGRLSLEAVGQEAGRGAVGADVRVAASRVAEVEPEHLPDPHACALLQQRVEGLRQDLPLALHALRIPTVGGVDRVRAPADLV